MLIKAPPSGAGFPPSFQALKFSTSRVAVPCVTGACFGSSWLAKAMKGVKLWNRQSLPKKPTCFTMKLQKFSGCFSPSWQGGPPERSLIGAKDSGSINSYRPIFNQRPVVYQDEMVRTKHMLATCVFGVKKREGTLPQSLILLELRDGFPEMSGF